MRTLISLFLLLFTFPALAQDPPGRVGRLSYVDGQVSAKTPDQADWQQATLNYPVSTGQSFLTDQGAKAEIQVGAAELRLDQDSQLDVTRLDDSVAQFALPQGTANIHVHTVPQGGLTIRTPKGDVALTKAGSYRIATDPDQGQVELAVLEGEANFKGPRGSLNVEAGESAAISGDPINVTFDQAEATDFDNWALSREQREPVAASLQYVSPQTTGYQDLDRNGSWQTDANYGPVWYPTTVTPDWAPYRYGHWAYIRPWGWTWIDDAPWGFAPFHYGRWVRVGPRWGWWPGTVVARPVYAPALVAFVGGNGFDVSISIGGSRPAVGWIPLAPHEVFRPAYRVSPTYVRNVNITTVNKTVINNITINNTRNVTVEKFANREAVTTVSREDFARGAKVQQAKVEVAHDKIAKTRIETADMQKIQPQHVEAKVAQPQHVQPRTLAAPQQQSHVASRRSEPAQRQDQRQTQPQAQPQVQPQAKAAAPAQQQARPQAQVQQRQQQQREQAQQQEQQRRDQQVKAQQQRQQQAHIQQGPRPEQTTQLRPTNEGWRRDARQEPSHAQPQAQPQQQQQRPQPQQRQQDHADQRKKKDES